MTPSEMNCWYPTEWPIRRLRPSPGWRTGAIPPTRLIAGQTSKLSRTMHDIRYDEIHDHDEIVVSNPFAQAILTFRGDADGEEAPIRIIQGPKTQLEDPDRLEVDPVHNEIFVPNNRDSILVFRRDAQGDVARAPGENGFRDRQSRWDRL